MRYRTLGRTRLCVSEVSLGTVELGMEYGLKEDGESSVPAETVARNLLNRAIDSGVNFIDTAAQYGNSEEIIGRALKDRRSEYVLATKCMHRLDEGLDYAESRRSISESIDQSLSSLQTDYIDLLQVHGRDSIELEQRMIWDGEVMDELEKARKAGKIRYLGYSSYSEDAALAAIGDGRWDTLQIACNILDRRYLKRVIPEARKCGVGIIVRSALLKGALTEKIRFMPERLKPLSEHIDRLVEIQSATSYSLPELALRFVLSIPDVSTIIVGADRIDYLEEAVSTSDGLGLSEELRMKLDGMALDDPYLLNPGNWGIP